MKHVAPLVLTLTGCIQSHIGYRAAPLPAGQTAAGVTVGGFYGTGTGSNEMDKKVGMVTADANAQYGLATGFNAGASVGTTGIGFDMTVGYGVPGAFGISLHPSVRLAIQNQSLDVAVIAGFGPVTVFGFWGSQTEGYDVPSYRILGGGGSYRIGPYLGGFEVQQWGDADGTILILQAGYYLADDGT